MLTHPQAIQDVDEFVCDVFISCLNSHSDGTHSLQMIHWKVMLNFSKSVLIKENFQVSVLLGLVIFSYSVFFLGR